ncbi:MAG: hypothetical protein KGJ13_08275 [Patescibacteria group bacterium]|nr:hypothetical protein [Patescibacteria group bacterium]
MIDKIADEMRQMFQETAEVTIKAIAEPTREMVEAGKAVIVGAMLADVLATKPADMLAADVWRAMHAAMLKESAFHTSPQREV